MASDDWAKIKPTTVDIPKLIRTNPQHRYCKLCIHASAKNPLYVGLYCDTHNKLLTWINDEQFTYLRNLGIDTK